MPKLDVVELLEANQIPDTLAIEQSLGRKNYGKYKKLVEKNTEMTLSDIYIALGNDIQINNKTNFGFERMYYPTLCYALAAMTSDAPQALKSYQEIIHLAEDIQYKDDIEDARINDILKISNTRIQQTKLTPIKINPEVNIELQKLIQEAYSYQDKTLAERLDTQYQIYIRCDELIKNENSSSEVFKDYENYHRKAKDFISIVFDTNEENKIHSLMKERESKKNSDPEYIPRKTPVLLRSLNNYDDKKIRWKQAKEYSKAVTKGTLLEVNDKAREKDKDENVIQLNAKERDNFRVHISDGKFNARAIDNTFNLFNTNKLTSHGHAGFGAYVINSKGEISVFSHYGLEKPFAHSSLNSQASVYAAGEIKIQNGELKELTPYSGHYKPNNHQVLQALIYFKYNNIDISNAVVNLSVPNDKTGNLETVQYNALDFFNNPQITKDQEDVFGNEKSFNIASTTQSEMGAGSEDWGNFSDSDTNFSENSTSSTPDLSPAPSESDWADFSFDTFNTSSDKSPENVELKNDNTEEANTNRPSFKR